MRATIHLPSGNKTAYLYNFGDGLVGWSVTPIPGPSNALPFEGVPSQIKLFYITLATIIVYEDKEYVLRRQKGDFIDVWSLTSIPNVNNVYKMCEPESFYVSQATLVYGGTVWLVDNVPTSSLLIRSTGGVLDPHGVLEGPESFDVYVGKDYDIEDEGVAFLLGGGRYVLVSKWDNYIKNHPNVGVVDIIRMVE